MKLWKKIAYSLLLVWTGILASLIISDNAFAQTEVTEDGFEYIRYYDYYDYGIYICITGYSEDSGDVIIPSEIEGKPVIDIGNNAFSDCTSLTSISIPESVIGIGNNAFSGCTSLTSISIPDSVISIGNNAFLGCTSLTSISIPDSVTSIGNSAFSNCTFLSNITLSNKLKTIDYYTFYNCTQLTSITIPDGVASISNSAFSGCTSLTSISIPDSVILIGDYAFENYSKLTIYGIHDNSYACVYAQNHGITFTHKHTNTTDWIIDTEPTCTTTGLKARKCKDCDKIMESVELPIIDHIFTDWQTEIEATCTKSGTKSHICTMCNKKESEKIEALGHNYAKKITKPTCTGIEGYTTYTCTRCNDINVIPLTHNCTDCNGTGYKKNKCIFCNSTGYKFSTTNCTKCKGTGETSEITTVNCPQCHGTGVYYSEHFPYGTSCFFCSATGKFSYEKKETCSACKGNGTKTEKITCSYCDGKGSTAEPCFTCLGKGKIPDEGSHDFSSWKIISPATPTLNGVEERTCTVCGISEKQDIPYTTTPTSPSPQPPPPSSQPVQNSNYTSTTKPTPTASNTAVKTPPNIKKISKLTAKNKKKNTAVLSWKKVTDADGYELQYATDKKFRSIKKKKTQNIKISIKKLKKGKTYYFRIRAYKKQGQKTIYGKWSITKKFKIRK